MIETLVEMMQARGIDIGKKRLARCEFGQVVETLEKLGIDLLIDDQKQETTDKDVLLNTASMVMDGIQQMKGPREFHLVVLDAGPKLTDEQKFKAQSALAYLRSLNIL